MVDTYLCTLPDSHHHLRTVAQPTGLAVSTLVCDRFLSTHSPYPDRPLVHRTSAANAPGRPTHSIAYRFRFADTARARPVLHLDRRGSGAYSKTSTMIHFLQIDLNSLHAETSS